MEDRFETFTVLIAADQPEHPAAEGGGDGAARPEGPARLVPVLSLTL